MPITKPRPNISELLDVAVKRRKALLDTTTEILERPSSIWITSNDTLLHKYAMKISWVCMKLLANNVVVFLRVLISIFVAVLVAIEVDNFGEDFSSSFSNLELLANSLVLLEAVVQLLSIPIFFRIETAFEREVLLMDLVYKSAVLEILVCAICYGIRETKLGSAPV